MMKLRLLLLLLLAAFTPLHATEDEYYSRKFKPLGPCIVHANKWTLEFKPGAYRFTDDLMRQFFKDWIFNFRFELDYKLKRPFSLWIDGGYLNQNGNAIGPASLISGRNTGKTTITIASATAGAKAAFFLHPLFSLYGGVGARYFVLWNQLQSQWVQQWQNSQGFGGAFLAGFLFDKSWGKNGLAIDLFADYSLKVFNFRPNQVASVVYDIDIDGLTIGAGLGWRF